jgi:tRNA (guanine37-N1)-methyltransferase
LAKAGAVSGTYRVRDFEIVAGEPRTDTVHKEHGCKYYVDLATAYFSPRLSHEHKRVASLVADGETVADLFAGVGPFTVLIAKKNANGKVHAVDINPNAVEFLRKNIRLNRVENRAYALLGDARQVAKERLHGIADRVIMNLPESTVDFVDAACEALKSTGGIVHFYSFVDSIDSLEDVQRRFARKVEEYGRKVEVVLFSRFVRGTAPYEWQIVLDAKIA